MAESALCCCCQDRERDWPSLACRRCWGRLGVAVGGLTDPWAHRRRKTPSEVYEGSWGVISIHYPVTLVLEGQCPGTELHGRHLWAPPSAYCTNYVCSGWPVSLRRGSS